jgi:hypothetical protein
MLTIIPTNSAHLQDGKIGGGGNLFILEMPRVLCWIVPEGDNLGHGGLWSDNSRHHVGCSFSKAFPTKTGGMVTPLQPRLAPRAPDVQQLNQDKLR